MWDYFMGGVFVAAGAYFYAVSTGRIRHTEASQEYWAKLRTQQPFLVKYLPPFLIGLGILRLLFKFFS
jgi:hypothetical protein